MVKDKIKKQKRGFIHIIVIFIMAIVILSLLGVDLGSFLKNETIRSNFKLVWDVVKSVWKKYLTEPTKMAWDLFLSYVWLPLYAVIREKI